MDLGLKDRVEALGGQILLDDLFHRLHRLAGAVSRRLRADDLDRGEAVVTRQRR